MPARDIFLCHAHLDKVTHARPLVDALSRRGISCWVDEAELLPGASLIDAISDGLISAHFVVLLITENFLQRNWTQRELNAALSREIRTGSVVVIPILTVDHDTYARRYPLLEDKVYLNWVEGVESLADRIAALFAREPASEWHQDHPKDHVGLVWVRVLPSAGALGREHSMTLRWGPYIKDVKFTPQSQMPVSFLHHKTNYDLVTLHVHIEPASVVTFGQGTPPDKPPINIDEGWTRSAGGYFPGHL
jgi:TIR domain-containing protein